MTRVSLAHTLDVAAPAADLWAYITDWPRHGEWIPLTKVETVGGGARGVGGKIRAWSGLGPLGFWDPITITAWDEQPDGSGHCAFVHTGRFVKGDAEIMVSSLPGDRSRLEWFEWFDLGLPGRLAWRVAGAAMERTLARALQKMAAIVEARG